MEQQIIFQKHVWTSKSLTVRCIFAALSIFLADFQILAVPWENAKPLQRCPLLLQTFTCTDVSAISPHSCLYFAGHRIHQHSKSLYLSGCIVTGFREQPEPRNIWKHWSRHLPSVKYTIRSGCASGYSTSPQCVNWSPLMLHHLCDSSTYGLHAGLRSSCVQPYCPDRPCPEELQLRGRSFSQSNLVQLHEIQPKYTTLNQWWSWPCCWEIIHIQDPTMC